MINRSTKIKVIGIGVEGRNTLSALKKLVGVEYIFLKRNLPHEEQRRFFDNTDMAFIIADEKEATMPILFEVARSLGVLAIAIVIGVPEPDNKDEVASTDKFISMLKKVTDSIFFVPKDRSEMPITIIRGITELVTIPGLMKMPFSDIQTCLSAKGLSKIGLAIGNGTELPADIAKQAAKNIDSFETATSVIINIRGNEDTTLSEISEVAGAVQSISNKEAYIIFEFIPDQSCGEMTVTIIATGFGDGVASISASEFKSKVSMMRLMFGSEATPKKDPN